MTAIAGERQAPCEEWPAPFLSAPFTVEPGWIDYNGHLNMAYYHVLFDRGLDDAFALLGLGPDYARGTGASFFTAEAHVVYLRELHAGDRVQVTLQLLGQDEKRAHVFQELLHADEGWTAATCELMSLHVDLAMKAVVPWPAPVAERLQAMAAAHRALPVKPQVGRVIAIPGPEPRQQPLATEESR